MSRIRSAGTYPEKQLHTALKDIGLRHRMNPKIAGKPDAIIPSKKIAIFVHGCFWHSCKLHGHMPKSNLSYWQPKLVRNAARDKVNTMALKKAGWKVLIIWEHDVKAGNLESHLKRSIIKQFD